ncbi:MAG: ATP-binding cassette domain-containing protein [Chromatiales bacterium]|nr:ATP-binding cassette domain-containing protein [Gammaproteobacteria bacterium]MBW6476551.1 ATP-binding cassette domain-containing protein [Chromatiales bacterium]
MIQIEKLQLRYDTDTVLTLPDWQAARGEHWLLLGPSGSGKTSLLHLLAGLLRPTSGRIHIAGQDIGLLGSAAMDQFRARHIGMVFQRPHLLAHLNVLDNLRLAPYLAELPQDDARITEVLAQLDLQGLERRRPEQLSQGQLQRLSLARAVLNRPGLLLADEPTANLDDAHCEQVLTLLKQQAESSQATLVIATHDRRLKSACQQQLLLPALEALCP